MLKPNSNRRTDQVIGSYTSNNTHNYPGFSTSEKQGRIPELCGQVDFARQTAGAHSAEPAAG